MKRRGLVLFPLLMVVLTGGAVAQEAGYPSTILSKLPGGAVAAVICPSLKVLESQGDQFVKLPGLAEGIPGLPKSMNALAQDLAKELELEGIKDFPGLGKALGLNPNQPAAVFAFKDTQHLGYVLPVASQEKAEKTLAVKPKGEAKDTPLGVGEITAKFKETAGFGYFFKDGYAFAGDSVDGLKAMAGALGAPRSVRCGSVEFPVADKNELLVFADLKNINLESLPPFLAPAKPALSGLVPAYDEGVLGVKMNGSALNLRLAGHSAGGAYTELPPLQYPGFFGEPGAAMAALRLTKELKDFIGQQIAAWVTDPNAGTQIKGIYTGLSNYLGEEIAVSVTSADEKAPNFLGCVSAVNPSPLMTLLSLAKFSAQPAQPDQPQISVAKDLLGVPIYAMNAQDKIVVGVDEAKVKGMAGATPGAIPAGIPPEVLKRAGYGFLFIDGARGLQVASELSGVALPADAANAGNLTLTLEQYGTWRQAALNVSNAGPIAAMLGNAFAKPKPAAAPAALHPQFRFAKTVK